MYKSDDDFYELPQRAIRLAYTHYNRITEIRDQLRKQAVENIDEAPDIVWYDAKSDSVYHDLSSLDQLNSGVIPVKIKWGIDSLLNRSLKKACHICKETAPPNAVDAVVSIIINNDKQSSLAKIARLVKASEVTVGDVIRPTAIATGLTANNFTRAFGGGTPIATTLAGGLIGAGLGYAGGSLLDRFLPDEYVKPGYWPRLLAMLGGAGGAAPGALLGIEGMRHREGDGTPWRAWIEPNMVFGKSGECRIPISTYRIKTTRNLLEQELKEIGKFKEYDAGLMKAADTGASAFMADIPVDQFNRTVWSDPLTPIPVRAATTGLLESANQLAGSTNLISPFDIARIAVGAGTGLISATVVGKTLGALAGLTPSAQKGLQRAGLWAGVLTNVVPMAFGFNN